MVKLILSLALSAAMLVALALTASLMLAESEANLAPSREQLLTVTAQVAAERLRLNYSELARAASRWSSDPQFSSDVRALATLMEGKAANARVAKLLQGRMEMLRRALRSRLETWRQHHGDVDSITLVAADGTVLSADSPRLSAGEMVRGTAAGSEALQRALTGVPSEGVRITTTASGISTVHFVSAEPMFAVKGKLIAVLMVEAPLRPVPGADVALAVDGQIVVGKLPPGLTPAAVTPQPALALARAEQVQLPYFGFNALGVDPDPCGIWAIRFKVPGTERAFGIVVSDTSEAYRALAERQSQLLVWCAGGWLFMGFLLGFTAWQPRQRGARRAAATAGRNFSPSLGLATDTDRNAPTPWSVRSIDEPETPPLRAVDDDGYQPLQDLVDVSAATAGLPTSAFEATSDALFPGDGEAADDLLDHFGPQGGRSRSSDAPALPRILLGDLLEGVPDEVVAQLRASEAAPAPPLRPVAAHPSASDDWEGVQAPDVATAAASVEASPHNVALAAAADMALGASSAAASEGPSARDQLFAMLAKNKSDSSEAAAVTVAPVAASGQADVDATEAAGDDILELEPESEPSVEVGRQAHYRAVFEEFVRLRKSCGEPGELAFDKFVARLTETRAQVMAKHPCKDVVFQAYVKNGKAALKATPRA